MHAVRKDLSKITFPVMPATAYFGEVRYRPGSTYGPRIQPDVQFVIVHEGEAYVTIDGMERHIPAAYVACLHPGHREFFHFARNRSTHHTWAALHFEPLTPVLRSLLRRLPFCLAWTRRLQDLLEAALSIQRRAPRWDDPVLIHLGAAFFHAYAQAATQQTRKRPVPDSVLKARRLIEDRYAQPLTLADLADAAGVSPNHLVRLFTRHLGTTPIRYLWQVRVQRSVDLLRYTGLSISEVAYRTGFATPYHFSRLFKSHLGTTPTELRRTSWRVEP